MTKMTTFEKQRHIERKQKIARTRCKICKQPIGSKSYIMFEERYFHTVCLRTRGQR